MSYLLLFLMLFNTQPGNHLEPLPKPPVEVYQPGTLLYGSTSYWIIIKIEIIEDDNTHIYSLYYIVRRLNVPYDCEKSYDAAVRHYNVGYDERYPLRIVRN